MMTKAKRSPLLNREGLNASKLNVIISVILCLSFCMLVMTCVVYAADDIFDKVNTLVKNLTTRLGVPVNAICILVLSICMVWRMVSSNPRGVEMATSWAKRAGISLILFNLASTIVTYLGTLK